MPVPSRPAPFLAALLLLALAGCSNTAEEKRIAALLPDGASFREVSVCHGSGCNERTRVRLDETDWGKVDAVFVPAPATPREERERIARAIGTVEVLVGFQAGTRHDQGRNVATREQDQQLDCVDETVNTTTYLRLIEKRGLLRFHDVGLPANRIRELVNAHNTAVVVDRTTGLSYAVDSWFFANGAPASVVPLVAWRDGWDPEDGDVMSAGTNPPASIQPAAASGG